MTRNRAAGGGAQREAADRAAGSARERWEKILRESAQQSRQLKPPALRGHAAANRRSRIRGARLPVHFSERQDARSVSQRADGLALSKSISVAIGPEGGWTDGEIGVRRAPRDILEASLGEGILAHRNGGGRRRLAILRYALGE